MTVLFADLRDSTTLAESMPSEEVVLFLNDYVRAMARAVFAHDGMLDKFLGDGLMAIFRVLDHDDDGAVAAEQMRDELQTVNALRGGTPIRFGVGVNTGTVVLGSIGIARRSDFTAVGDTVNTAARLQEPTKEFGEEIVPSAGTVEWLPSEGFRLRKLGNAPIRGRREAVELYTVGD